MFTGPLSTHSSFTFSQPFLFFIVEMYPVVTCWLENIQGCQYCQICLRMIIPCCWMLLVHDLFCSILIALFLHPCIIVFQIFLSFPGEHELHLIWHWPFITRYRKEILKLVGTLVIGSFDGLTKWSHLLIFEAQITMQLPVQLSSLGAHLTLPSPKLSRNMVLARTRNPAAGIYLPQLETHGRKRTQPFPWW